MKNIFTALFIFVFAMNYGQYIHVEYENVISDISSTKEDLYISKDTILSVRDSIILFKDSMNSIGASENVGLRTKEQIYKKRYLKSVSSDTVKVYVYQKDEPYLIIDTIPKINWEIDIQVTKKILGYLCYQANAYFRGTHIVAYFTKELNYSAAPYKFNGLPGVVLEVSEKDKNYNLWIATNVDVDYKKEMPDFNKNKFKPISLKSFVQMKEESNHKLFKNLTSKLSSGVRINKNKKRYGIEKVYEWE